jgi:aminomethyltransferase
MSDADPAATTDLRRSPLEPEHRVLGARMAPFAGWLMPIEYAGTLAEHRAVREAVGVFDLTHLGKVAVAGAGAADLLQRTMPNDISKVPVGGAQYNMVLNDRGGIVDDLINYRVGEDRFLVVPNAANVDQVFEVLRGHAAEDTSVDVLTDLALVAPQGPRSAELVGPSFPEAASLDYMHVLETDYRGSNVVVSRSGYTGELGFELFVPYDLAADVWTELLDLGQELGAQPCGLGARDTLRLEMGYPLHGNDISQDRTPLEAGLSWAVALDKGNDFIGRRALVEQKEGGVPSRLWGLRMREAGRIPRAHYPVLAGEEQVGETTSGTFSPTRKVGIALAYLSPRDRFGPGDEVDVDIRGRRATAEIVKPPFVDASPK